ncbi:MAG: substrate-binding protein [Spirosoma sp.]|nr:substrate-binding protein [Spirosoma sp.]
MASKIAPSAEYVAAIQANNEDSGILIGRWVVDKLERQPLNIALLSGAKGSPVGQKRREGMLLVIARAQLTRSGCTNYRVVAQGWGGWSNNGDLKAMEDILVVHPDVNVLLAENDAMALGAMRAIREAGKTNGITIVAVDGQKKDYQLIGEGKMGCTAMNSPNVLGRYVVEAATRHLNGDKQLPKVIYTPAVLVTKENVQTYYNPNAIF